MNRKTSYNLRKMIEIAQCLLEGKVFHVLNSEVDLVPIPVMTKTAAKKKGLVLKRGAKPVGTWNFQIGSTSARANGDLFLASSFKAKPSEPSR